MGKSKSSPPGIPRAASRAEARLPAVTKYAGGSLIPPEVKDGGRREGYDTRKREQGGRCSPRSPGIVQGREYSEKRFFEPLTGFLCSEAINYPPKRENGLRGAKNGFFPFRPPVSPVGYASHHQEQGDAREG